jgi:hypothetical protein
MSSEEPSENAAKFADQGLKRSLYKPTKVPIKYARQTLNLGDLEAWDPAFKQAAHIGSEKGEKLEQREQLERAQQRVATAKIRLDAATTELQAAKTALDACCEDEDEDNEDEDE